MEDKDNRQETPAGRLTLPLKYRPMTFEDVVGQEHVIRTLRHALASGRVANAYLFVGSRGIGKTTLSRIFAKALNCLSPEGAEPCGKCANCRQIAEGRSLDVTEIDGASHNKVEDVHDIIESVKFAPSVSKYRIFIIDEVHMLTAAAFNALLKTLEEPPPHVKFIFATTEGDKVLPTILSRCQRIRVRPAGASAGPDFADADLLDELMTALLARKLGDALEVSEKLAALPSREVAKSFCTFAADRFRQVFLAQQGVEGVGEVSPQARQWAAKCRKTFPRQALEVMNRTQTLIGRNVNLKILFADMADRLYIQI